MAVQIVVWLAVVFGEAGERPFWIQVVDDATGRGVPLVELRTVNDIRYFTDSNGIVAVDEPGLANRDVHFQIKSHGYEYPKDGFGFRGKMFKLTPGGHEKINIKRLNIAERLYRVTGGGIYRDSFIAGQKAPIEKPTLNADVFGSDSVVNTIYKGKLFWIWGDTNITRYPLGHFQVTAATSELPASGGLDPDVGVNLNYFVQPGGTAKTMCPIPGEGATWIWSLVTLDVDGRERLFASYEKTPKLGVVTERGLVMFDDEKQEFVRVAQFDLNAPISTAGGHAFRKKEKDGDYFYFSNPYPLIRVRANVDALKDITKYEAYTCLKTGERDAGGQLDRDASGKLHYGWKANTALVGVAEQAKLVATNKLQSGESLLHLTDIETGRPVRAHVGSTQWNEYRQRWTMVASEQFGTSVLGEVWWAEADTPVGPWVYARKILTHDKYSFYNPTIHTYFQKEGGRIVYFEGTYTNLFSGNNDQTPRYDYNQIMHKLDLADPRLALPVAHGSNANSPLKAGENIAFFALDRPVPGSIALEYSRSSEGGVRFRQQDPGGGGTLLHGLPPSANPPPNTFPIMESPTGSTKVIGHVWKSPRQWNLSVE